MLRQIETGKSSPTVATLWKIANGLHIPLTALFREETPIAIRKKFRDGIPLEGGSDGFQLLSMVPFDPKRPFEIYYLEIEPGASLDSEPHNGIPEEYIFVTQGQIKVTFNNKQHLIEREQFIRFQADRPHKYENIGEETATAINLVAYLS